MTDGARYSRCAAVLGLTERTRSSGSGATAGTMPTAQTRAVHPVPGNAPSAKERPELLRPCNLPKERPETPARPLVPPNHPQLEPCYLHLPHPTDPRSFKNPQEISLRSSTTHLAVIGVHVGRDRHFVSRGVGFRLERGTVERPEVGGIVRLVGDGREHPEDQNPRDCGAGE